MVSNELIIAAKRITKQMELLASHQIDMNMFMGLGMALATVYEIATGRSVGDTKIKPQQVIQWAINLPQVSGSEVDIDWGKVPRGMPGSNLV